MVLRRFYKVLDKGVTKYFSLLNVQTLLQADELENIDGVDHATIYIETPYKNYKLSLPVDQVGALFQDIESKLDDIDNFRRTGIWPKPQ